MQAWTTEEVSTEMKDVKMTSKVCDMETKGIQNFKKGVNNSVPHRSSDFTVW